MTRAPAVGIAGTLALLAACTGAYLAVGRPSPGVRAASIDATCALPERLRRDQPVDLISKVGDAPPASFAGEVLASGIAVQVGGTRKVAPTDEAVRSGFELGDPRLGVPGAKPSHTAVAIAIAIDRVGRGTSARCRRILVPGHRTDGGALGSGGTYWPTIEVPEPGQRVLFTGGRDGSVTSLVRTVADGSAAGVDTSRWPPPGG